MAYSRSFPHAHSRFVALAVVGLALGAAPTARAGSFFWAGGDANLWSSASSWAGGTATSGADTDLFFGTIFDNDGITTNNTNGFTFRSITFFNQNWTVKGTGNLNVANGGNITAATSATINVGLNISNFDTVVSDGVTLDIEGFISTRNGTLNKTGTGTLVTNNIDLGTLTDDSLLRTTISAGRLIAKHAAGSYVNNGELEFSLASSQNYTPAITGTGNFTKSGAGQLTLKGASTYLGSTTITAEYLKNGITNALPTTTALIMAGGGYNLNGFNQTVASLSGGGLISLTAGNTLTVQPVAAVSTSTASIISGPGALVKSGDGTLTLTAVNTYTGGTTVNAGRLVDQNPHGTYTTNGTGILEFSNPSDLTFAQKINGSGAFVKSGAGTLTLTAESTYTGGTTVSAGRLIDLTPHGAYVTNAALEFSTTNNLQFDKPITGTGSFTKSGSGTLNLSGMNTFSGGTFVTGGSLIDQHPHGNYTLSNTALEFSVASNQTVTGSVNGTGTLKKTANGTLTLNGSVASSVPINLMGGTLIGTGSGLKSDIASAPGTMLQFDQTSAAGAYGGTYSGEGKLLKTGSRALSMTNVPTNQSGTRVSGGSLTMLSGGTLSGGLTVDATTTFANGSGDTLTVRGRSFNQGEVNTFGGSKTVFTGLVSGAGQFTGLGTVDFQGGYSPGNSPASVKFQGDLDLSSVLTMELGGATLGTGYDHLTVDGTAFLTGPLTVAWYGGFSATAGQTFDLFDFSHQSGQFSSVTLPTLADGLVWNTRSLYSDGSISVQAVPEPATLAVFGLGGLVLLRRRRN